MTEIQGKSILVRVSERIELARVRNIGSQLLYWYSWQESNFKANMPTTKYFTAWSGTKFLKTVKTDQLNTSQHLVTLVLLKGVSFTPYKSLLKDYLRPFYKCTSFCFGTFHRANARHNSFQTQMSLFLFARNSSSEHSACHLSSFHTHLAEFRHSIARNLSRI